MQPSINQTNRRVHSAAPFDSRPDPFDRAVGPEVEPSASQSDERFGGVRLPTIGLVVDASIEINTDVVDTYAVDLMGEPFVVTDFAVGDRWRVLLVRRPLLAVGSALGERFARGSGVTRLSRVEMLHKLGARQIVSASIGRGQVRPNDMINGPVCVVPERVGVSTSCPGLRSALLTSAARAGFRFVDGRFDVAGAEAVVDEQVAAGQLHLCHSTIDVAYTAEDGSDRLTAMLADVLSTLPLALSPAAALCEHEI